MGEDAAARVSEGPVGSAVPTPPDRAPGSREEIELPSTGRVEAFSDGVFAIAITLLVLGLHAPNPAGDLPGELLRLWPSYLAYAISFLLIGQVWLNHHAMFRHIDHADHGLVVLNLLLLLDVAALPFPTEVLAGALRAGQHEQTAAALYGATLAIGGIFFNALWRHAAHGHRLLTDRLSPAAATRISRRFLLGPIVYGIGAVAALAVPTVAVALYAVLILFYLWPRPDQAPFHRRRDPVSPDQTQAGSPEPD